MLDYLCGIGGFCMALEGFIWHWRSQYGQADLQLIWPQLKCQFILKIFTLPLHIDTLSESVPSHQVIHSAR